ncbi:MAG: OsmC family protein [Thermodesulfovibrionales bacterium]|nr:OsmC family protein [Thermodesulfovibrionales bacterium]
MQKAVIKWQGAMQFDGFTETGHVITMDSSEQHGGANKGARPTELLLLAIAGCSGMDIISILKKKKQEVTDFEINVTGIKSEAPARFIQFDLLYIVKGKGISEEAVKRAIELSMQKYCSVKLTLEHSAKINTSYQIIESTD